MLLLYLPSGVDGKAVGCTELGLLPCITPQLGCSGAILSGAGELLRQICSFIPVKMHPSGWFYTPVLGNAGSPGA